MGKLFRLFCSLESLVLLVKMTIVVMCSSALFVQGLRCFLRYLDYQTSTILSVKPTGKAPFMAFTICPDYYMAYSEEVLASVGSSKVAYQRGRYSQNLDLDHR